jgi:hypothetical protein
MASVPTTAAATASAFRISGGSLYFVRKTEIRVGISVALKNP